MRRILLALLLICLPMAAFGQAPPYVQRELTAWMPSNYLGSNFWVSGVAMNPAAPHLHSFVFPSWVPQQFYITRCRIGHAGAPNAAGGEFSVIVDVGHAFFNSGKPPYYQQGDHSHNIGICTLKTFPNEPQMRTEEWSPPVFFDQNVDGLWIQQDINYTDAFGFTIGILVPGPGVTPTPIP